MSKIVFVVFAVALVALATGFAVSSGRKPTGELPNLTGTWASWRSSFRITNASGHYEIDVTSPDGFLGGRYSGVARAAALEVAGPISALCGEIRYVKDGDKLEFCGEEFERTAQREKSAAPPGSSTGAEMRDRRS